MKWAWRILLILLLLPFFLPEEGSRELRNLPLLVAILTLFAVSALYRLVCLRLLARRVAAILSENGYTVKSIRRYLYSGYVLAENGSETLSICLLLRKRRYYRYHFRDTSYIEFWITSFWTTTRNRTLGSVARSGLFHSMLGGQKLRWPNAEGEPTRFLVIDKMPNRVTDASPESGELCEGDRLLSSEITLLLPHSFARMLAERNVGSHMEK